jgi:hypothetical protein
MTYLSVFVMAICDGTYVMYHTKILRQMLPLDEIA